MRSKIDIALNFQIAFDMVDLLCGDFVGEGNSRIVYDCPIYPGYVTKISKDADNHDNIMEYEMWCSVAHQPKMNKWFADVKWLSGNGRVMIQKKAIHINDKNKKNIPTKVPAFLSDMKFDNYGFIGKQFVCFDYAFSAGLCMSYGMGNKMKTFKSHLNEK